MLDCARTGELELFTSIDLLGELEDVLGRERLASRLSLVGRTPRELITDYAALARLVMPAEIEPVIEADPDDDAVLACAVAARAHVIVSGDRDLLGLRKYGDIPILRPSELLLRVSTAT